MFKHQKVLFLALSAFIFGCTGNISDTIIPIENGGVGIIIPGSSVEGVEFGDSPQTVYRKLGKPSGIGWSDGFYRSWRSYIYLDGPHAGLIIDFIDSGATYGPVDQILIGPPYNGKTRKGIGIGSSLAQVHKFYGLPDTNLYNLDQQSIVELYCINQKKFEIHYQDSIINRMSTGYLVPMLKDPLYPCK